MRIQAHQQRDYQVHCVLEPNPIARRLVQSVTVLTVLAYPLV